jgi:hypothetical protein
MNNAPMVLPAEIDTGMEDGGTKVKKEKTRESTRTEIKRGEMRRAGSATPGQLAALFIRLCHDGMMAPEQIGIR